MTPTHWRPLSDRGTDLVLCLDFPGGRAAAGFADLAAGVPIDACLLHIGQTGDGTLTDHIGRWTAELRAIGRPVRAVLGYCAGAALASRVADAVGAAPVVLFDAVATTAGSLADQLTSALESSAAHLTTPELDDARDLTDHLVAAYPDDLPRIAAALTERYDQLMRAVAERLSLPEFFRQELTTGFTTYLGYLLLTAEGGFDTRSLFVSSKGHEPPITDARTVTFDVDHADLLRDSPVHQFVTDLLTGDQPCLG